MSTYTTMLRTICEYECGLDESVGFNEVNNVLNESWNKIFTSNAKFFDEEYKPIILKKVLKHYYLREIGSETVGIFKLWVNTKLEEILPYYNKLYESANLEYNPLFDYDVTTEREVKTEQDVIRNKTGNETEENKTKNNSVRTVGSITSDTENSTRNLTSNSDSLDKYSDTPQGTVSNLSNETYLSNARIVDSSVAENTATNVGRNSNTNLTENDDKKGLNKTLKNSTENENTDNNTTENYIERRFGKTSGYTYSKMIQEYRETLINIDKMFIDEFDELFLQIW